MRRIEKPSARFLGLLHGQAVIRSDAQALSMIEARAHERGIMPAVARHSSAYIVRRFSLDWMQAQDQEPRAEAVAETAEPIAKVRRNQIDTASNPMLHAGRGATHRVAPYSRH
jgi:hypothetical protein